MNRSRAVRVAATVRAVPTAVPVTRGATVGVRYNPTTYAHGSTPIK